MQFDIEYARIANQIFRLFHQQLKYSNHECQMPVAHSVFKQTVLNVGVQQLQQHTIKVLQNDTNCLINELVKQVILYRRQNGLLSWYYLGQLWSVSLIVFQHSISHMLIHWHIHMVHFLLLLHVTPLRSASVSRRPRGQFESLHSSSCSR